MKLANNDGKEIFQALCDNIADNQKETTQGEDDDIYGEYEDDIPCFSSMFCEPVAIKTLLAEKKSKRKGLACQICTFEGRPPGTIGSVVICLKHRIRCCTQIREQPDLRKVDGSDVTDYSWRSPQHSMSCWAKAHDFYISKGLFKDDVDPWKEKDITLDSLGQLKFQGIRVGSDLNKRKKKALGITSHRGRKKQKQIETTATTDIRYPPGDQQDPETNDNDLFSL